MERLSFMKTLIKTDYQYFLIPLTYFAVWFVSSINYLYCGMPLKIIKPTAIAILIGVIFIMLIPLYVNELLEWEFVNYPIFFWIYFYVISIPASIYFIKDQQKNNIQ